MKRARKWMGRIGKALVLLMAAVVIAMYLNLFLIARANADGIQEEVWVLCSPTGTVNIREKPSGEAFGGCSCGASMWTDGKQKNGFLHVMELAAEEEEGWISARYIVYDEPWTVDRDMWIWSEGRVACRKWIGGKIIRWMQDGERVHVFSMSEEWAVTEYGFIRCEYLTEE